MHTMRHSRHQIWRPLMIACAALMASASAPSSPMQLVEVEAFSTSQSFKWKAEYYGAVQAGSKADLAFDVPGLIAEIKVDHGDSVARGDVLAALDNTAQEQAVLEAEAQLRSAESQLELALLDLDRSLTLRDESHLSQQNYDRARILADSALADVDRARAGLAARQYQLQRTTLIAPFSGTVANRLMDQSTFVGAGRPVLSVVDASRRFHAQVSAADVERANLEIGGSVNIRLGNSLVLATVSSLGTSVNKVAQAITVIADLDDPAVREGQPGRLLLSATTNADGGWLPLTALTQGERGFWQALVAIPSDDLSYTTEARNIRVLHFALPLVYVVGDISDGDLILQDGTHLVTKGQRVRVQLR